MKRVCSTPLSDHSTMTPPCSPPCGTQEMEEGELLEDTHEDLPELSDISDEECSVAEYDTNRYYRGGRETGAEIIMLDSPASPDMKQVVTGSPVKIIPRSPQPNDTGGDSVDEEEDLDEDILYLRLIALRSLAVEDKKDQNDTEENKLAIEMQELLEEAEVAANEESGTAETGDDRINNLVSRLKF